MSCLSVARLTLAATLCAALGMAHAHDAADARSGAESSAGSSAPSAQLDDIRGQYQLADGRVLTIGGSGRRIRAQLDGRPGTLLVPAGGAVFDARDGAFRLRFDQHANGNVTGVTLEAAPERGPAPGPLQAAAPLR